MLIIKIKDGNLNKGLKELKVKFSKSKVVKELQERKEYTKKSVRIRKTKLNAKYRQKKQDNDTND